MFSIEIKANDLPGDFPDLKSYSQWINKFLMEVGKVKVQYKSGNKYDESSGFASFVYTLPNEKNAIFDAAVIKIYKDREKQILSKVIYDKPGKSSPFPIGIKTR